jgi:hypothetical protein
MAFLCRWLLPLRVVIGRQPRRSYSKCLSSDQFKVEYDLLFPSPNNLQDRLLVLVNQLQKSFQYLNGGPKADTQAPVAW